MFDSFVRRSRPLASYLILPLSISVALAVSSASFGLFLHEDMHPLALYGVFALVVTLLLSMLHLLEHLYTSSDAPFEEGELAGDLLNHAMLAAGIFAYLCLAYVIGKHAFADATVVPQAILDLPIALKVLLSFSLQSFLFYWQHRISHVHPFFWMEHRFHHSAKTMRLSNTGKLALGEMVQISFISSVSMVSMFVLEVPLEYLYTCQILYTVLTYLQHSDLDIRYGFLSRILVTNYNHRYHHSTKMEEANYNYSADPFLLWDYVFGTQKEFPRGTEPQELGFFDAAKDAAYPRHNIFKAAKVDREDYLKAKALARSVTQKAGATGG